MRDWAGMKPRDLLRVRTCREKPKDDEAEAKRSETGLAYNTTQNTASVHFSFACGQ